MASFGKNNEKGPEIEGRNVMGEKEKDFDVRESPPQRKSKIMPRLSGIRQLNATELYFVTHTIGRLTLRSNNTPINKFLPLLSLVRRLNATEFLIEILLIRNYS